MICHACQNSSLKQSYINNIFCDGCKAVWKNTVLPKSSIDKSHNHAEKCAVCDGATLVQNYPNTIHCPKCNTKWTNGGLSQFGKNQKSYYASKHRESRK